MSENFSRQTEITYTWYNFGTFSDKMPKKWMKSCWEYDSIEKALAFKRGEGKNAAIFNGEIFHSGHPVALVKETRIFEEINS